MGKEKTTQNAETKTETKYEASPEEREYLARQNKLLAAGEQDQISLNRNASELINQLLRGQDLPGYLKQIPYGISEDVTGAISKQAIADITPQFQSSGILDSGVAAQIAARTSSDIRNQSAQFNLQNLSQLLNLAVGGQSQVQQPLLTTSGQYGQSLSGLRNISQTGSSNNATYGMNPFLKSFQQSAGQSLGSNFQFKKQDGMFSFGSFGGK